MLTRLSPLLGERCGFDVEALYNKYKDGSKQSPGNETSEKPRAARKTSSALDDLQICASCQGYGLVKQHYNFTVKDTPDQLHRVTIVPVNRCQRTAVLYFKVLEN